MANSGLAVMYAAVAGLLGVMVGSAINALVWRLYVGRSWVRGRSECPDCGHTLAARDLVPVVSWVLLGGRCRYCGKRIHWQYPVVELVTGLVFAWSAWVLAPAAVSGAGEVMAWIRLGFWLVMLVMLVMLAVYDWRWLLLPDKVMGPLVVVALVYAGTMAALAHTTQVLVGAVVAAAVAGGAFYALVYLSKGRAMGGGDIKLAFAMGLMLGVQGTAVALLLAFNVAAVVGLMLMLLKRRGRKDQIPFGPFLVGGTVVAFLAGRQLVDWYLRVNGLY